MTSRPTATPAERLFVALQHLLPQHLLSQTMYRIARSQWRPLKDLLIRTLVRAYRIDLDEAAEPDPRAYPSFSAFFTRELKAGARPLDPDPRAILCPVDGRISQIGSITDGRLIQAKGHDYSVRALLGLAPDVGHPFDGGAFATIYLAPSDYHRIHMAMSGTLTGMTHVPGRLFSVNDATARLVPGLFARNERLVCDFATQSGAHALVMVGAIFVGGMETVWAGEVTPPYANRAPRRWSYTDGEPIRLERGAELGRFNLGSTVVLLFPPGAVSWDPQLAPGHKVRLGQRLGLGG